MTYKNDCGIIANKKLVTANTHCDSGIFLGCWLGKANQHGEYCFEKEDACTIEHVIS